MIGLGQVSFVQSMHVLLASQMGQLPVAMMLPQSGMLSWMYIK